METIRFQNKEVQLVNKHKANLVYDKERHILELESENLRLRQENFKLKNEAEKAKIQGLDGYKTIFNITLDGIITCTPEESIITANQAACKLLGVNELDLCKLNWKEIFDQTDPRFKEALKLLSKNKSFQSEMVLVRGNGTKFPCEVSGLLHKAEDGRDLVTLIIRDIIKRKQADESLRLSKEKFSKAFYNNQTMMVITTVNGVLLDVNDAYLEKSGFERHEIIGKNVLDYLWANPQDREATINAILTKGEIRNCEHKFKQKNGETAYYLISASTLDIGVEKLIIVSGVDITERKKAEESLRLSEELFHKIFNVIPLPIVITSMENYTIVEANKAFFKRSGYTRQELLGYSIYDLGDWDANDLELIREEINKNGAIYSYEINKLPDVKGNIDTYLFYGCIIKWHGQDSILGIAVDITKLRKYEKEMTRSDRLNLIGKMSASIAHEIRNPMTSVKGFLQLLKTEEKYMEDWKFMDLMIEEMDRANDIITEFLSLARDKALSLRRENLNDKIENLMPLIKADAMENDIEIILDLNNIPDIMLDEAEFRQLILNLVRNGVEAMSPGSKMTIKTYNDSNGVTLAIQDQGHGMTPEVVEKLGTPFFTTKPHGNGLGLPVCFSIAGRHNARIEVETSPAGTIFKVKFPGSIGSGD